MCRPTVSRTIQPFILRGLWVKLTLPKRESFSKVNSSLSATYIISPRSSAHWYSLMKYSCTTAKLFSRDRADVSNFRFLSQYARSSQSTVVYTAVYIYTCIQKVGKALPVSSFPDPYLPVCQTRASRIFVL